MKQELMDKEGIFLTLTYHDAWLPKRAYYATLKKEDLTNFIKRLRKALGKNKIKYYGCGEYGEQTQRPHYHLAVFGLDFKDVYPQKAENGKWTSALMSKLWQYGMHEISPLTPGRILYITNYMCKNSDVDYGDAGIVKPYSVMSQKMGYDWLYKSIEKIKKRPEIIDSEGHSIPLSHQFIKKIKETMATQEEKDEFDALLMKGSRKEFDSLTQGGALVLHKTDKYVTNIKNLRKNKADILRAQLSQKKRKN